jgi:hypothetical protein
MDLTSWMEKNIQGWKMIALLTVLILISLSIGLNGEFHRSDKQVLQNPFIMGKGIGQLSLSPFMAQKGTVGLDHYRPFTVESLRWNYSNKNNLPISFRLINGLIHLGAAWLLFRIIGLWSGNHLLAILSSLLFAVHPITISAVLAVPGREEILFVFLGFLAWFLHLRKSDSFQEGHAFRYTFGISVAFLAALLSHEKAWVFFFLLLMGDWLRSYYQPDSDRPKRRWYLSHYIGMITSFCLYAVWKYVFIGVRPSSLTGRMEAIDNSLWDSNFFVSLAGGLKLGATYLWQLFFSLRPRGIMYDFIPPVSWMDAGFLLSVVFWLVLAAILVLLHFRRSRLLLPLGSMILSVVPLLNWLNPTPYALSSFYMYLPLFGAALLLAYGLDALSGPGKKHPVRSLGIGAILLLSFLVLNLFNSYEQKEEIGWLESINRSDPGSIKVAARLSELLMVKNRDKESLAATLMEPGSDRLMDSNQPI